MLYDEADLYDTLLPASAAELSYYSNLARNHPTAALELACGSGQSIIPVASLGLSATGLDQSSKMLLAGKRRATAAGAQVQLLKGAP
jgi:ubiquinone/menaquinone biosynthesis C-methylase UbiE